MIFRFFVGFCLRKNMNVKCAPSYNAGIPSYMITKHVICSPLVDRTTATHLPFLQIVVLRDMCLAQVFADHVPGTGTCTCSSCAWHIPFRSRNPLVLTLLVPCTWHPDDLCCGHDTWLHYIPQARDCKVNPGCARHRVQIETAANVPCTFFILGVAKK
jgi:hypothetical protein